jgi:acyl carrier protein
MPFPRAKIESAIRDEIRAIKSEAIMRRETDSRASWEPEIDSQNALRISLRIEDETKLVISEDNIPPGGFQDVESCISAFLRETEKAWLANREKETVNE